MRNVFWILTTMCAGCGLLDKAIDDVTRQMSTEIYQARGDVAKLQNSFDRGVNELSKLGDKGEAVAHQLRAMGGEMVGAAGAEVRCSASILTATLVNDLQRIRLLRLFSPKDIVPITPQVCSRSPQYLTINAGTPDANVISLYGYALNQPRIELRFRDSAGASETVIKTGIARGPMGLSLNVADGSVPIPANAEKLVVYDSQNQSVLDEMLIVRVAPPKCAHSTISVPIPATSALPNIAVEGDNEMFGHGPYWSVQTRFVIAPDAQSILGHIDVDARETEPDGKPTGDHSHFKGGKDFGVPVSMPANQKILAIRDPVSSSFAGYCTEHAWEKQWVVNADAPMATLRIQCDVNGPDLGNIGVSQMQFTNLVVETIETGSCMP